METRLPSVNHLMLTILAISSILSIPTFYYSSPVDVPNSSHDDTSFLMSVIGMVMAIGIANLVKGYDVLIKYWPESACSDSKKDSRWIVRFLWGVNLLFLIVQLVWGMRLALNETESFLFFVYYGYLGSLVYAMVVYIFPENIEGVFINEFKTSRYYWSPQIVVRLCKLYLLLGLYMTTTIPMSFIFYIKNDKQDDFYLNLNIFGAVLKFLWFLLIWKRLWMLKKRWGDILIEHAKARVDKDVNRSNGLLKRIDYLIIFFSICISVFYIWLRCKY